MPLDHAALLAWRTLMGVPLPPPDAALILELDRLWRRIDAEAATQPAPADDEDF